MRHIKTVICENCGKEFESRIHNAKFCCRRCANQRHEANRKAPRTFRCPHNHEVTCSLKNCALVRVQRRGRGLSVEEMSYGN